MPLCIAQIQMNAGWTASAGESGRQEGREGRPRLVQGRGHSGWPWVIHILVLYPGRQRLGEEMSPWA